MNTRACCECGCYSDIQRCKLWFSLCDTWDCWASFCEEKRQTAALTSVPGHWGKTLNHDTEKERIRVYISEVEVNWQVAVRSMIACLRLTADVGEETQPRPVECASSHRSSQWCSYNRPDGLGRTCTPALVPGWLYCSFVFIQLTHTCCIIWGQESLFLRMSAMSEWVSFLWGLT